MISAADTERGKLLDLGADHMAGLWWELKFPQKYVSTRFIQGHEIAVIVCNGELAKRLTEVMRTYEVRISSDGAGEA